MRLLLDMNLSPRWVEELERHGWEAVHWSDVGDPRASDRTIMGWAREAGYVVLTHDLDFGALLAASSGVEPSVVQVRTRDVLPEQLASTVVSALKQFEAEFSEGAFVVVEPGRVKVRILPLT